MKTKLTAAFGICLLGMTGLKAQIPNPYFETWDARTNVFPASWKMEGTYTRITGPSAPYAVRLSNNSMSGEIGMASQVGYDTGGMQIPAFSINGTADSVRITYRSGLGNDTAVCYIFLSKSGDSLPVVFQEVLLSGNTTGWVTRSFALEYIHPDAGVAADGGYLILYSADPIDGPLSSGYLEISDIGMYKSGSRLSNIPNHNFATWDAYTFDFPVGWTNNLAIGWDFQAAKNHSARSTDARSGSSAIKLQAYALTSGGATDTIPGFAVTVGGTAMRDLLNPDIETPIFSLGSTTRPNAIHGYIKSSLYNNDKFMLFLNLFHADSIVGSAVVKLGNNYGSFTEFAEDIAWIPTYSGVADSAVIGMAVADSSMDFVNDIRSWAIVDDLWLENYNVKTRIPQHSDLLIYPNPARDLIHVKAQVSDNTRILLMTADGRMVKSTLVMAGEQTSTIQTAGLPAGLYIIQIEGTNKTGKILLQP